MASISNEVATGRRINRREGFIRQIRRLFGRFLSFPAAAFSAALFLTIRGVVASRFAIAFLGAAFSVTAFVATAFIAATIAAAFVTFVFFAACCFIADAFFGAGLIVDAS